MNIDNIKINTQSSIRIEDGGKVFYFDPFEIGMASHDADFVFITHDHYDHLDPKSILNVMKEDTKFICSSTVINSLIGQVGEISDDNIIEAKANETISIDSNISFEAIPAYNVNKNFHKKEFEWLGYILKVNGTKYYIAGDTDITDENKKVKCDIALVPIGGTYTMDSNEAASLINTIKPKIAIPTHYGSIVGTKDMFIKFKNKVDSNIVVYELL